MNKEIDQDRVFDLSDHYKRFGYVMFPENRKTYEYIAKHISGMSTLEAGCGNGVGSAGLERVAHRFIATDKLEQNIQFASQLYPWISFRTWDLNNPWDGDQFDAVVCVEAIEHVSDPETAIQNLIKASKYEVWFSTPNRSIETPDNPYHTREYSVDEVYKLLTGYKLDHHIIGNTALYHITL